MSKKFSYREHKHVELWIIDDLNWEEVIKIFTS
jgi:hypothetical protein